MTRESRRQPRREMGARLPVLMSVATGALGSGARLCSGNARKRTPAADSPSGFRIAGSPSSGAGLAEISSRSGHCRLCPEFRRLLIGAKPARQSVIRFCHRVFTSLKTSGSTVTSDTCKNRQKSAKTAKSSRLIEKMSNREQSCSQFAH